MFTNGTASYPESNLGAAQPATLRPRVLSSGAAAQVAELTVGGNSEPHVVSGALAARVREQKPVCLTAIGSQAVANSIRAICHARLYLEVIPCRVLIPL